MENYGEYTVRGKKYRYKKFFKISSESEAYFIGYMACDGSYLNGKYPRMRASSTEKYIMECFREEFCPDSTIYDGVLNSSDKVKSINKVFELGISSKMRGSLNNFGVFCYKPERRVVGIPNRFFHAYMAGVIDADGFITVTHRKDCRTPRLRFFITHAGDKFLSDLQSKLIDVFELPSYVRQHGDKNCYRLSCQHTNKNMKFLAKVLPWLKNRKKIKLLTDYLDQYSVPQVSGELRETERQSAANQRDMQNNRTLQVQRLDGEQHEQ